ncbi:MAG: hypothetical protein NC311_08795 [Muribaculaceae bacterium]|nr:hypothetical protein [Muribaculaceae bacterium]MCM1399938.1 hypothetical protein [Clostridium sp.]MCM1460740.1 hypothetical protein [Bacteroides sp.]
MSGKQIQLFKDYKPDQLQSYISAIQEIKNADYGNFSVFENTAYLDYANALEGVSASQAAFLLSTQGLTNAQIAETLSIKEGSTAEAYKAMVEAGLLKSKQSLTNAELQKTIATKIGNEEDAKALMSHMGLAVAIEGEEVQTVQLTTKKLQQAVATGLVTESQAQEIAMTSGVTVAEKAATASTKGLTGALRALWLTMKSNPLLMIATVAPFAIEGISKLVDALITTKKELEENRQKIRDLGKEARSSVDSINSNFESTKSTVDSVAERYATLAQEVGNLGKASQNQGTLSNDEYSEFLDISNQLADLFPRLTNGYNDNGDAILNLSGDIDTITSSLYGYLDAEKAVASLDMQEKMGDIWGEYSQNTSDYSNEYNRLNDEKRGLSSFYDAMLNDSIDSLHPYYDDFGKLFAKAGIDNSVLNEVSVWSDFSEKQQNAIKDAYALLIKEYEKDINDFSNKIEAENKDFSKYLITSLQGTDYYEELGDYKSIVNSLLTNYGYDMELYNMRGSGNWDKALEQIKQDIIKPFNNLSDEDKEVFQEYYNNLLSLDTDASLADNIPKIEEYISKLAELLDMDVNKLTVTLGYDLESDKQAIETAKTRMGYHSGDKLSRDEIFHNMTINKVANSLTGDNITLLANADIPQESYNWTERQWMDFINELQKEADENPLEIPTSLDTTEALKAATDAFSKFGDAENGLYADILAGKNIDSGDIYALKDDFGDIDGGRALENFADVLLQFPGDVDKAQEALNALVTSYLDESDILDNITEEHKDYIIQELEKIGVINAEEVVNDRLNDSVKVSIKAFHEFSKVLSEHIDILKNGNSETEEYKNSLETVKTSFEEFLNANSGSGEMEISASLSDDFIIQNLEDIESAASGSEEALNRLRVAASKDIAANISMNVPQQAYDGILNQINSWIDNTDLDTLEVGTYIDELPLVQGLQDLVKKGAIAQKDMNNILAGIGATPEISMEPVPVTLPNGIMGATIGMVTKTLQLPRIRYKMASNFSGANFSNSIPASSSKGSGGGGGGGSNNTASEETKSTIDWIARHLEQLQKTIDKTKAKFENLFTLKNKSKNLEKQIKQTTALMNAEGTAADKYLAKAKQYAKSSGLSSSLQKAVQNGRLKKYSLADLIAEYGQETADKINQYQDYWDKYQAAMQKEEELITEIRGLKEQKYQLYIDEATANLEKITAQAANARDNYKTQNEYLKQQAKWIKQQYDYEIKIAKLNKDKVKVKQLEAEKAEALAQLEVQKFENIASSYDHKIQTLTETMDKAAREIEQLEAAGKNIDVSLYKTQRNTAQSDLKTYKAELTKLEEQLKNIKKGTDEWYDAKKSIEDVKDAISKTTITVYELNTAINELQFQLFEDTRTQISRIAQEYDFMLGLADDLKKINEDNAQFTDMGYMGLGTNAIGYYASLEKQTSDKLTLDELNGMLAKGILSNKNYTFNSVDELRDKIDELYDTWQSDIQATYSYEKNLADAMTEKYQAQLSLAQKLTDERKASLQAEKDLHDYQRTISNQVKDINALQMQINAYRGDTSEEGMAKLQALQKSLSEAQDELKETEYDRYISDQEDMLSTLYTEYEELISKKLDDFYGLVKEGLASANGHSADIADALGDIQTTNQYTSQFNSIITAIANGQNIQQAVATDITKILDVLIPLSGLDDAQKKNAKNKAAKLESAGMQGFARGGVISDTDIKKQVEANGDSVLVSAQPGERILTPVQNQNFEKLINSDLVQNPALLTDMSGLLQYTNAPDLVKSTGGGGTVAININSIDLPNVINPESFGDELAHQLQNNKKIQNLTQGLAYSGMLGKSANSVKHIH